MVLGIGVSVTESGGDVVVTNMIQNYYIVQDVNVLEFNIENMMDCVRELFMNMNS